jgi:hypothetical protein
VPSVVAEKITSATRSGVEPFASIGPITLSTSPTSGWYSVRSGSLLESSERPPKSVFIPPGSTTFTRTPKGRTSYCRASDNPSTANVVPW